MASRYHLPRQAAHTLFKSPSQLIASVQAQLRQELAIPYDSSDTIHETGSEALSILQTRPQEAFELATKHLNVFPFYKVSECWRRFYTEASLWKAATLEFTEDGDPEGKFVEILDMAVIIAGAPKREKTIHHILSWMATNDYVRVRMMAQTQPATEYQAKRRKVSQEMNPYADIPNSFPTVPAPKRKLNYPIPRFLCMSFAAFQMKLNDDHDRNQKQGSLPFIITQAITEWPALADPSRSWKDPHYWLLNTIGGRRLVPVEVGRAYTDDDWSQKIIPLRDFFKDYLLPPSSIPSSSSGEESGIGYLAQHDLFTQIPGIKSDIRTPDYCYSTPPTPEGPNAPSPPKVEDQIDDVKTNIWLGPAGTISPLHTDPHHNILTQVFGYKYVRLYAPSEGVYPKPKPEKEGDVDMSNTSQVDVGLWINGESCETEVIEDEFPHFKDAKYVEEILAPGEALYIPRGWWHYVESLSVSCSVSFWWDD
ncbi:jumonji domain-containing 5 [Venturia nashicola]|nr:jumonji domain-containing 5 [Venturia nashicola]